MHVTFFRLSIQNNVKCKHCKYCFDCFLFAGGNKVGSLGNVEFNWGSEMRDTRTLKKLKQTLTVSQTIGWPATGPHESKGGEIRYKILQRVPQDCFVAMFRFLHLAWSTCRPTKMFVDPLMSVAWGKLLRKEERRSTLSNQFWVCSSFIIKLTTGHATNFLMLRDKLRVVSRIFRRLYSRVGRWAPADRLLQLSFAVALLWLNSV